MNTCRFELYREMFQQQERLLLDLGRIQIYSFCYAGGIEALRLKNERGYVVVLPYYGQMVWDAVFDGVDLKMENMFSAPKYAENIAGTYGCFAFHSGLLSNGCPGKDDTHPLHGEFSCAAMDRAYIEFFSSGDAAWVKLISEYEYVMGFGSHYLATPEVCLESGSGSITMNMKVKNLSQQPMPLMYMCHINFAFAEGGRIIQPLPFTADNIKVRTEIPGHVVASPEYVAFIEQLDLDPTPHEELVNPEKYNPEQVFYLLNMRGEVVHYLKRQEEDSFFVAYDADNFTHAVRWLLYNSDQKVAAFVLPSTCEPEGYNAELKKGNVRMLGGEQTAEFSVCLGHLDKNETDKSLAEMGGKDGK